MGRDVSTLRRVAFICICMGWLSAQPIVFAQALHPAVLSSHDMACHSCRLLPQWVAAGDCPESAGALLQQMPPANANALRLLVQTCSYMNEQAAVNEMDSQALAEVGGRTDCFMSLLDTQHCC
jgi:hypothetical protein